jgi:hypothetical protein
MSNNIMEDVKLSLNNLDENAMDQGLLYAEWSKRWAESYLKRDKLKEKLSVLRARLDSEIREKATEKITETQISQKILLNEEHQKLTQELIEIQFEVNLFMSAKESFDHRRKGLDVLTELFKAQYFAGKQPYKELIEKKSEEVQDETLKKNNRLVRRS